MKGATMLVTMQNLGIAVSFCRPSVSNDNPYSESLFKTPKCCPQCQSLDLKLGRMSFSLHRVPLRTCGYTTHLVSEKSGEDHGPKKCSS